MTMRLAKLIGLATLAACSRQVQVGSPSTETAPVSTAITDGRTLVQAMHDRYAGHWYRTLTFVQKTTLTASSGQQLVQTWYEAGELPGKLRIDIEHPGSDGVLFVNDSVFQFSGGRLVHADTGMNELVVLGFDVYAQQAAVTSALLQRRGYDLSKLRETEWEGRRVYVVGAAADDTVSKQFWVDKERLLFVRLIETRRGHRSDVRFGHYVQHEGGWVAEDVLQFVDGTQRLHEEYSAVRVNVTLPEGLFDARRWGQTPHWYSPGS